MTTTDTGFVIEVRVLHTPFPGFGHLSSKHRTLALKLSVVVAVCLFVFSKIAILEVPCCSSAISLTNVTDSLQHLIMH